MRYEDRADEGQLRERRLQTGTFGTGAAQGDRRLALLALIGLGRGGGRRPAEEERRERRGKESVGRKLVGRSSQLRGMGGGVVSGDSVVRAYRRPFPPVAFIGSGGDGPVGLDPGPTRRRRGP